MSLPVILDLDASITQQHNLVAKYSPKIIDLSGLAGRARFWLDNQTKKEIEEQIRGLDRNSVVFLGSGDFHHLSSLLISRFEEPITVIDFDLHPDWDILPPRLGCGSWVTEVLKNKNIAKFILLGASNDDLSFPALESANLNSLKNDRLQVYPYAHPPSRVFFRSIAQNISLAKVKRGLFSSRIYWSELKGLDLDSFFKTLFFRLPTKKAYLTIDKDCLKSEYALTNWEEGMFSLGEFLLMLKLIRENLDIVGVDITGDYSPVRVSSRIKAFLSRLDRPHNYTAKDKSESRITGINEETNIRILECLKVST